MFIRSLFFLKILKRLYCKMLINLSVMLVLPFQWGYLYVRILLVYAIGA